MTRFTFHPGLNGLAMLALAIAAMVLVALFYRRAYSALRHGQWWQLYLLRMAEIGIVLLLLFRPVYHSERELADRRSLVFLLDTSASMSVADEAGGVSRIAAATDRLHDWFGKLRESFDIQLLEFADTVNHLKQPGQLANIEATGESTSLSRALESVRQAASGSQIEAAILMSDGMDNGAGDPIRAAGQLGFTVHTIGVGNSLRDRRSYRDVRVTDLECPEQLFVDNTARLTGYVDASGFPGRVVWAVLRDGDEEVSKQELVLDDVDGPQEVLFEIIPSSKGLHTYALEIPPSSEERIAENNRRSVGTLVVDAQIRLLYLEGTLRSEYGAVVGRFLAKDPDLEFCALVRTRPNTFVQRSNIEGLQLTGIPKNPELLKTFDVFLIGDLDHSDFDAEALGRICQRVRDGAGLLMLGGYHSLGPGGYEGTPIEDLLPVFLGDRRVGQITAPFLPVLTPDGRRHPIFANIASFFPSENRPAVIDGLPQLQGCVRVLGAKPGGTVLAIHPSEQSRGEPMPVMVVQPVDQGRTAVFTGDTTRNWHQGLRASGRVTPFLRFWGQTVRWLAGKSDEVGAEAGIAATTDKSCYEPESKIEISAIVRGEEGAAATGATVKAVIQWLGKKDLPGRKNGAPMSLVLQPVTGPSGHYQGVFTPQRSGRYEISVEAAFDETALKAETLTVEVGRPYLEFDRLDLDDQTLIAIANETSGRYAHITTADRLIERLTTNRYDRQVQYETSLSPPSFLWVLFVIALTTEWLLRRRYQLR